MTYRVGIDIGGTFTDFALQRDDDIIVDKVLSTPEDRSLAVMQGLEKLASHEDLELGAFLGKIEALIHGTTIADNTLIEMNGAVTGLLTTEGFRDELEMRRGFKEDIWDVRLPPPPQIAPRRRRLGVPERILFDGSVYKELDEQAALVAIRRLRKQGVESVAISLLFSFVNPAHERRLAELVRQEMPDAEISLSCEVLPRAPEFERTSTTVVNAYVGPKVTQYLETLTRRLRDEGYPRELLVMQSSGGVMTRDYLRGSPIRVLASGPAGGVVGSAHVGLAKNHPDLLCVDMGGTSYDVSLVLGGRAPAESGWNWHHRNLVAVPMISVETLGAGGGSICRVEHGVLRVGPESAGAAPGPICYGRGGERPTVTDANLVLGLLSEDAGFAGGSFRLSRKGVDEAFEREAAGTLERSVEEVAFDCWRVVNANMTQAVRRTTAGRGIDPRDLTMLAYGGNGPVFAAIQAQELGIKRVLIPKASATFSALGALSAEPAIDEERSYLVSADVADLDRLLALWTELDERAERTFAAADFKRDEILAKYQLNIRYAGQNWSLTLDVCEKKGERDLSFVTRETIDRMIDDFHTAHQQEYGHRREGEMPEITGVRLQTSTEVEKPSFASGTTAPRKHPQASKTRRANLGAGFEDVSIYSGPDLVPGSSVTGPGIIEESFTTIVVYPGWEALVDDSGDYILNYIPNPSPNPIPNPIQDDLHSSASD
ncbi:MAG: hydantoinase/oxoprolinase family protein [Deltaproteobacteria bacterium]|nr:hydantoinase/oxoprolinase family protein [Deltaproteobacteria bacterium]